MGPLGFWEIAFILVLALLIFGPKRLPEIGKQVGKGLGQFRRASSDLRRTLESELSLEDDSPRPRPVPPRAVAKEPDPPPASADPAP